MMPIWEPRPRESSIKKNKADLTKHKKTLNFNPKLRGKYLLVIFPNLEHRTRKSEIWTGTGESNVNLYQKGAPGILVNTSAITMKANPVPWAESSSSLTREQFLMTEMRSG